MFDYFITVLCVQEEAGDGIYWLEQFRLLLIFTVFKNNVQSSSLKTMHVQLVWRSWLTWGKICLPEWITNKQRQSLKHCEAPTQWIKSENLISLPGSSSGLNSFPSQYFTIPFSKKMIIKKRSGIDSCTANARRFSSLLLCCCFSAGSFRGDEHPSVGMFNGGDTPFSLPRKAEILGYKMLQKHCILSVFKRVNHSYWTLQVWLWIKHAAACSRRNLMLLHTGLC